MKLKLFEKPPVNFKPDIFSFESVNFKSENKAYAFFIEVENIPINSASFEFIFYDQRSHKIASAFTLND